MPCIIYIGHKDGRHAPGAKEDFDVLSHITHHCLLAHGHGVAAVRERGGPDARVGVVYNAGCMIPAIETPEHVEATREAFSDRNGILMEPMAHGHYPPGTIELLGDDGPDIQDGDMGLIGAPTDFLGFNIYGGSFVEATGDEDEPYRVIDFPSSYPHAYADWIKIAPQALYWGVRFLNEIYDVQEMYITENGCAMDDQLVEGRVDDVDRVQFYRWHLDATARCVEAGLPLKGYFAWSLLDNFEWAEGYSHRFGLHYVDFETQKRTPKLSAQFYAACIRERQVL
jgi:beta-glucosidase